MKDYNNNVRQLVDDIKAICTHNGLGGEANEYKIVTQSFLYKFLNDKFMSVTGKSYAELKKLSESEYEKLLIKVGNKTAKLKPEHLLEHLFNIQNNDAFAKTYDETLNDIAIFNNAVFSVHTDGKTDIRLFEESLIQNSVTDRSKHNGVAKAIINKLTNLKFDFDKIISAFLRSLSEAEMSDFAVILSYDKIKAKNYSLAAGQYFDIKIARSSLTPKQFEKKISESKQKLNDYFKQSRKLESAILKNLGNLKMKRK